VENKELEKTNNKKVERTKMKGKRHLPDVLAVKATRGWGANDS
jgi:hypothetical protein